MEFMNTTYMAAASFLPQPLPKGSLSHSIVGPTTISLPLDPWSAFNKLWTAFTGYPAEQFRFTEGFTPFSTLKESLGTIALYYVVIFGGRELMRNRDALKLNKLFIIHNLYLTIISGALLVLFAQQLIPTLYRKGLYDNICGASGWTQRLTVLYYLNYLTKYLELLDTVFLVLKKKPLTFLHTYHHGATALLCYSQLLGHTSVSWVPITLNLTVHVVMYWYYFQAARGVRIWWKKYITVMQITQFVLDLGFVYFASWDYFTSVYAPTLPHVGTCAGEEFAAFSGCAILSSYLVLFIGFYLSTYRTAKKSTRASAAKTIRRGSKVEVPTAPETVQILKEAKGAVEEAVLDVKI